MSNIIWNKNFTNEIRKLETSDPGHADVFNPINACLLGNDMHLKGRIDNIENPDVANIPIPDNLEDIEEDDSYIVVLGKLIKAVQVLLDMGDMTSSIQQLQGSIDNKAPLNHSHAWSAITSKPTNFPPSSHNHEWSAIMNKPTNFPPSGHNHDDMYYTEAEINTLLNGKSDSNHGHSIYYSVFGGFLHGNLKMFYNNAMFWADPDDVNIGARVYASNNESLFITAVNDGQYYSVLGIRDGMHLYGPDSSGRINLGSPNHKWNNVYANNGSINTSDRNLKKDIANLDQNLMYRFITGLKPSSYVLRQNESGRRHYGLIAQDVEELLEELEISTQDFAGFIKSPKFITIQEMVDVPTGQTDDEGNPVMQKVHQSHDEPVENEYIYGLRYEEFIAPLISCVQMQSERIKALEERILELESRIN